MNEYNTEVVNQLMATIDVLDDRQTQLINCIVQYSMYQSGVYDSWFQQAICPALQEYANMIDAPLTIKKNGSVIKAIICSDNALDLTKSCHAMKMAILVASHVTVSETHGKIKLELQYQSHIIQP